MNKNVLKVCICILIVCGWWWGCIKGEEKMYLCLSVWHMPLAIYLNSLGHTLSDSGYYSYFSAAVNRHHDQRSLIKVFTWGIAYVFRGWIYDHCSRKHWSSRWDLTSDPHWEGRKRARLSLRRVFEISKTKWHTYSKKATTYSGILFVLS